MKKILLAGASLNSGNKGVNALTRGQINLILDQYGQDVEIIILSYTVTEKVENKINYNGMEIIVLEIPCSKKTLLESYAKCQVSMSNSLIELIKSSDVVLDISEGDSFSDIYGAKRFVQHSIIKLICIKLKKKIVIMPQTIGPFDGTWVKKVAANILNKADYVFVRDKISKNVAENELKVKRKIEYVPDMAFYMVPSREVSLEKFITKDSSKEVVGLNVSALLYKGGYTKNNMFNLKVNYQELVDTIITHLLDTYKNVNLMLIPHVMTNEIEVEDDFRVCSKIKDKFKEKYSNRIFTIDRHYREDEIKAIISGTDFFIGSRMHACIGAVSTEVPTMPIAYSRKFIGIWNELELAWCVADPRENNIEEIIKTLDNCYSRKAEIKEKLVQKIPQFKGEIKNILVKISGGN